MELEFLLSQILKIETWGTRLIQNQAVRDLDQDLCKQEEGRSGKTAGAPSFMERCGAGFGCRAATVYNA